MNSLASLAQPLAVIEGEPGARLLGLFLALVVVAFAAQRRRARRCYACE